VSMFVERRCIAPLLLLFIPFFRVHAAPAR
jgi:hypothetical protein